MKIKREITQAVYEISDLSQQEYDVLRMALRDAQRRYLDGAAWHRQLLCTAEQDIIKHYKELEDKIHLA